MYPLLYAPVGAARSGLLRPDTGGGGGGASPITWETSTDWDNATSESGVVHESVSNTDHNDSTIVKQGYKASSPLNSTDLILYWPLDENSGTTANDLGPNSNNGTVSGATLGATGVLGTTAYSFDGTDDSVSASPTHPSTFSIALWVKTTDSNSNFLAGQREASGNFTGWDLRSNGKFNVVESAGVTAVALSATTTITDGNWHYIVATHDNSAPATRLYIDGTQEASETSTAPSHTTSVDFGIGARVSDGSKYAAADIDDVRYYNSELTSTEVSTLYDVVNTTGSLETSTKSFSSAQSPDLVADVQLNGVTDAAVDVIGSPSGTSETNTVQVNSSGENTYTITWSSPHTNFRVKPKPDNESDVTRTPTVNKLELSP